MNHGESQTHPRFSAASDCRTAIIASPRGGRAAMDPDISYQVFPVIGFITAQ